MRAHRRLSQDSDAGVYAVLYAALVVVLVAFAAIVVDLSGVRQDRRLNRSAADAAALGGAGYLLPSKSPNPRQACITAWQYLNETLQLKLSLGTITGNCSGFPTTATPCPPSEIGPNFTVGDRTIRIAWPIPSTGGSGFLNADIAPGNIGQPFDSSTSAVDGSPEGCDRLGVAISQHQGFHLAGAFGPSGTDTQVHSVALAQSKPGTPEATAALNILSRFACQALYASGQGVVAVNPATDGSAAVIAVESSGLTADPPAASSNNCGNSSAVVQAKNNGQAAICAQGTSVYNGVLSSCDSGGVIKDYANGRNQYYYSGSVFPVPTRLTTRTAWAPVASVYGCHGLVPLSGQTVQDCSNYPDYIENLYSQYDRDGSSVTITPYTGTGSAYTKTGYGAFKVLPGPLLPAFTCAPSNLYIPAGNWYINCPDANNGNAGFTPTGTVVFGGGHIIFAGSIAATSNGLCLAFNVIESGAPSCPTVGLGTPADFANPQATTSPAPDREAIVFLRSVKSNGNRNNDPNTSGLATGSSNVQLYMPQTMVAQAGTGELNLGGGTGKIFWSAPGGGPPSAASSLSTLCAADETCLDSHFERTAYWNESKQSHSIGGQGALGLVGTFFSPQSAFDFKGQAGFLAQTAQFWGDIVTLSGQGNLVMAPNPGLSFQIPLDSVGLIR